MKRFGVLALTALLFHGTGVHAFCPLQIQSRRPTTILLATVEKATPPPPTPTITTTAERTSYAEESRLYRRTVFTHDDWVRHRSPDRFLRNLSNFNNSGVYNNVLREVSVVTAVAAFVVVANMLLVGYDGWDGVRHVGPLADLHFKLGLPLTPFTLASPSLGLLLGTYPISTFRRIVVLISSRCHRCPSP